MDTTTQNTEPQKTEAQSMIAREIMKDKRDLAYLYYLRGHNQRAVAERVGVNITTLRYWIKKGKWDVRRASANVTRPELVNKNLLLISRLLDKANSDDVDVTKLAGIVDKISKLAAAIDRLDKSANVVDAIDVFTNFTKWLERRMKLDKDLTPGLIKTINNYQDTFITEQLNK